MFNVVCVDTRRAEALEPLGTKRKFWFVDGARRLLFKSEERGTGEDWAEKLACELAGLLGLPHVQYELATETGVERPGVLCESCAVGPVSLVLGNQLMFARDRKYRGDEGRKYKVREHTVDAVADTVATLALPPKAWSNALPPGIETALDVFAGYAMLDAWIANQDRHHENWGALREGGILRLAPTFDHGASLARNISDEERRERLTSRDRNRQIPLFARRARSAFYKDAAAAKSMTTVGAWRAFSQKATGAAAWLNQLRLIEQKAVESLLAEVPSNRMSPVGQDFTLQLLLENKKRLLAEDDQ